MLRRTYLARNNDIYSNANPKFRPNLTRKSENYLEVTLTVHNDIRNSIHPPPNYIVVSRNIFKIFFASEKQEHYLTFHRAASSAKVFKYLTLVKDLRCESFSSILHMPANGEAQRQCYSWCNIKQWLRKKLINFEQSAYRKQWLRKN